VRPRAQRPVLFCPFCRASFEGCTECPEHELTLIPIDKLPRQADGPLERVVFFADPRLGRGAVLSGATLVLLGFLAPFVRSPALAASALEVAIDGAGNLWFTPGAAIVLLWILWRRRSRGAMRAARAAVLGLAAGGALPLVYTARRIGLVAEAQGANVEWLWGLWLMVAGLLVAVLGGLGLGGRPVFGAD
jgi:hypothetical protein